jgi:hypothetical protein
VPISLAVGFFAGFLAPSFADTLAGRAPQVKIGDALLEVRDLAEHLLHRRHPGVRVLVDGGGYSGSRRDKTDGER